MFFLPPASGYVSESHLILATQKINHIVNNSWLTMVSLSTPSRQHHIGRKSWSEHHSNSSANLYSTPESRSANLHLFHLSILYFLPSSTFSSLKHARLEALSMTSLSLHGNIGQANNTTDKYANMGLVKTLATNGDHLACAQKLSLLNESIS